jgi:hypothetical protein
MDACCVSIELNVTEVSHLKVVDTKTQFCKAAGALSLQYLKLKALKLREVL